MVCLRLVLLGVLLQVDEGWMAAGGLAIKMAKALNNNTDHADTDTVNAPVTPSPEPALYHFEKDHPENVTVDDVFYEKITISWNAPAVNASDILYYVVNYEKKSLVGPNGDGLACPNGPMQKLNVTAFPNTTHYESTIKGLDAGTSYVMCVEAVYVSDHRPYTRTLQRQTLGCGAPSSNADQRCECSPLGTNASDPCIDKTCECKCKSKFFTGETCDACVPGYYMHPVVSGGECVPCDCTEDRSDGTCYIKNTNIIHCNCKEKYFGRVCSLCADGLTEISPGLCDFCRCNRNENPADPVKCDKRTGICTSCFYNTSGDYCEKCKKGYIGNALNRTCIIDPNAPRDEEEDDFEKDAKQSEILRSRHYERLHIATVAGVCVGSAGLLIMLVTICFVIRWKKLKRRAPHVWTIAMDTADEDRVKFSQMLETVDDADGLGGGGCGRQLFERDQQPQRPLTQAQRSKGSNIYKAVRT